MRIGHCLIAMSSVMLPAASSGSRIGFSEQLPHPVRCCQCGRSQWPSARRHSVGLQHSRQQIDQSAAFRGDSRQLRHTGWSPRRVHRPLIRALFTGIVQGTAEVTAVRRKPEFYSLVISFPPGAVDGMQIGASVAVNGTCLTVTQIDTGSERHSLSFDVIAETLRATNLGLLREGSTVNFERSARMGDEIGGHHVSGHVHTTASIVEVQQTPDNRRLRFQVPGHWMQYILPKGFIAVDGCSLTVGEVGENWFSVYLIPETLRATVLGGKGRGDTVNLEIDAQTQAIVDTVERVVARFMLAHPEARAQVPQAV